MLKKGLILILLCLVKCSYADIDISVNRNHLETGETCILKFQIDTSQYDYIRLVNTSDTSILLLSEQSNWLQNKRQIRFEFSSLDSLITNTQKFRILVKNKSLSSCEYLTLSSIEIVFRNKTKLPSTILPSGQINIKTIGHSNIGAYVLIIVLLLLFTAFILSSKGFNFRKKTVAIASVSQYSRMNEKLCLKLREMGLIISGNHSIEEIENTNKEHLANAEPLKVFGLLKALRSTKYAGKDVSDNLTNQINDL